MDSDDPPPGKDSNGSHNLTVHGPVRTVIQAGKIDTVNVPRPVLWVRILAAWSPTIHRWLIHHEIVDAPGGFEAEQGYLTWFNEEFRQRNLGDLTYISLAGVSKTAANSRTEYLPLMRPPATIRRIPLKLRLTERHPTDEYPSNQIAPRGHSRTVRNVARFLESTRVPIVLLGDPGTGKSTTLREVGTRIAERSLRLVRGFIPVFVSLGSYRQRSNSNSDADLWSLIRQSIPAAHAKLSESLGQLAQEGRLLLLFDGMDEMERTLYAERVTRLSQFATDHVGLLRIVFSCRTNDFLTTFATRQIVLMPFDRGQVKEYLHANFVLPVRVGERDLGAKQLVRELYAARQLDITNPLILYLIRHYIDTKHVWPERSSDLFDTYLDSVVARLHDYYRKHGETGLDPGSVIDDWAALAFEIAREHGGVYLEYAKLRERWDSQRAERAVESGIRSGLLTVEFRIRDPSHPLLLDIDAIGFFHHRIQEYLCARFLTAHAEVDQVLTWESLLDSPRWQETLQHIVGMRGNAAGACQVLNKTFAEVNSIYNTIRGAYARIELARKPLQAQFDAIKPIGSNPQSGESHYSPEDEARRTRLQKTIGKLDKAREALRWRVPIARERLLADRVLLSARLLGQRTAADLPTFEPIRQQLPGVMAQLANYGRPTSQLKMLQAWPAVSWLVPLKTLELPLRSKIAWLRDEAILAIGSPEARRGERGGWLDEMSLDFLAGTFLRRLGVFWRAGTGHAKQLAPVAAAAFFNLLYLGSVLISAGFAVYLTAHIARLPPHLQVPLVDTASVSGRAALLIAVITLLGILAAPFQFPSLARLLGLVAGYTCSAALAWTLVNYPATPAFHGRAFGVFQPTVIVSIPMLLVAATAFAGFWVCFGFYRLFVRAFTGYNALISLRQAWRQRTARLELWTFCLAIVALATNSFWLGWVQTVALIVLVCIYAAGLLLVLHVTIGAIREKRPTFEDVVGFLVTSAAVLGLGGLVFGFFWGLFWVVGMLLPGAGAFIETVVDWIGAGMLTVLGVGIGSVLVSLWIQRAYWQIRYLLSARWWLLSGLPAVQTPQEWHKKMESGNAYRQAYLLTTVSREQLGGLSLEEFLLLLESCEKLMKADFAENVYWRRRRETEDMLKHSDPGRVEDMEGSKESARVGGK